VKVDELRVLEVDELDGRLRQARRELYELRFKHAVGQLENSSQISKVRHDIARIMTVLTEREYGMVATPAQDELVSSRNQTVTSPQGGEGGEARSADTSPPRGEGGAQRRMGAPEGEAEPATAVEAKPKRGRKAKTEEPS
jgi:large subunit ribosomal protein L29